MPSGAKKRKAAKKKMKSQPATKPNPSSSAHTNGDDVKNGNVEERDLGGKQVNNGSNHGKDEQIEISESTKTEKSVDGGSSESSSGGSSDDESRASEMSSTKVDDESRVSEMSSMRVDGESSVSEMSSTKCDDSSAGGIDISGEKAGVPVVKVGSSEQIEREFGLSEHVEECPKEIVVLSADVKETVSERTVNGNVIQSVEETTVISEPKECLIPESDDGSILPYHVAGANADGGVGHLKDIGVTEPLLKPSLHPVEQKTTWKSCCGLFELFGK